MLAGVPGLGPCRRVARAARRHFPSLNFITLHYIYFLATCLLSSVVFWGASTPARSVSYTDSLFLTVSAMTLAGLNTVNLSTLNTFQQIVLFLLIIFGSAIFVSGFVVHVRKNAFEKRFEHVAEMRRRRTERARNRRHGPASLAHRLSSSLSRSGVREVMRGSVIHEPDVEKSVDGDPASTSGAVPDDNGPSEKSPTEDGGASRASGEVPAKVQDVAASPVEQDTRAPPASPQPNARAITYRSDAGDEIQINPTASVENEPPTHITFGPNTFYHAVPESSRPRHHRLLSMQGVGAHSHATIKRRPGTAMSNAASDARPDTAMESASNHLPFSSSGFVSRNSHFHHLSEEEREKLGGCEYGAIRLLSWLVPIYFILFQLLGCIGSGAYVASKRASTAYENGLNPWWTGAFNAVSAFNNSGMSLLDANMVAFQTSVYMLITMGLLILAGNTCYPIFLRLIVWTFLRMLPDSDQWADSRKTLSFLLEHPRRCYTNMFPAQHTWWLLTCVIMLNGIDWAAFEILNIGNDAITSLPAGFEILDGLFQALAVRSGGFYVVPIPSVRISLQVLYVLMMYISVYPVVITMRNSNVYEERSLGIYADDPGYAATQVSRPSIGFLRKIKRTMTGKPFEQTTPYFVRQQLRAQLAHDLWWIVLAVFVIMIIEGSNFTRDPMVYSVFNVIFETVSAYGCVGISVGLPNEAYSFSGGLHTLSKLVLCAVMIRGRHRGLPVAIDKAVMLPGESVDEAEEEDGMLRLERSISRGRIA